MAAGGQSMVLQFLVTNLCSLPEVPVNQGDDCRDAAHLDWLHI